MSSTLFTTWPPTRIFITSYSPVFAYFQSSKHVWYSMQIQFFLYLSSAKTNLAARLGQSKQGIMGSKPKKCQIQMRRMNLDEIAHLSHTVPSFCSMIAWLGWDFIALRISYYAALYIQQDWIACSREPNDTLLESPDVWLVQRFKKHC